MFSSSFHLQKHAGAGAAGMRNKLRIAAPLLLLACVCGTPALRGVEAVYEYDDTPMEAA